MQQVATVSRRWWRAHDDAPTSQTPPLVRIEAAGNRVAPARPLAPLPPTYKLRIAAGDRRRLPQRRRTRWGQFLIAVAVTGSALSAVTIIAAPALPNASALADRAQSRIGAALMSAGFGIDQVSLIGQRYTADADVFDALDLGNVRAFWQLDAKAALKRIERISWVDTAQLTRVYPGRVEIEIRERTPVATWMRGERAFLVDATGRVLAQTPTSHDWRLPRVSGEAANQDVGLLIAAVSRHPELAALIASSERVAERRWRINLKNGSRIELAAEREVEGLDQVAQSSELRKTLAAAPVAVDVRTQGRIAVRPLGQAHASAQTAAGPKP